MVGIFVAVEASGCLIDIKLQYYQTIGTRVPSIQNPPDLLLLQLPR
jgi:hypothetical protein